MLRFSLCHGILIFVDRGIVFNGHIIRAILLGTSCVIIVSMFAGSCMEPEKHVYKDGVWLKWDGKKGLGPTIISCESTGLDSKYVGHADGGNYKTTTCRLPVDVHWQPISS